jgi:hypothetical protein
MWLYIITTKDKENNIFFYAMNEEMTRISENYTNFQECQNFLMNYITELKLTLKRIIDSGNILMVYYAIKN